MLFMIYRTRRTGQTGLTRLKPDIYPLTPETYFTLVKCITVRPLSIAKVI